MNPNRYRVIFALLGIALAAVVVGAVIFAPSGELRDLPAQVDEISPVDGATVLRQTELLVDMQVDYAIELIIDGVTIPSDEIDFREATGEYRWRPGPTSTFDDWAPGLHQIVVRWDRIAGLPDPGELRWSFRIQ